MTDLAMTAPHRPRRMRKFVRWFVSDIRGAISLGFLIVLFVVSVLAPWLAPYDPLAQDVNASLAPMSAEHWLGADDLGRDTLSRLSVFPPEIEALLGQHPAVLGSGVVGRDDPGKGQVPVAFIQLKPEAEGSITPAELQAWCAERMAVYKVPEIRIIDALPMTATGKVKKQELDANAR